MGRRRSIKLMEQDEHGSMLLMQNHPDDCFSPEAENEEKSPIHAEPSAAEKDPELNAYLMCTRCGKFPQSTRKGVRKGLCCNKCPDHGVWCSGHACTSESCKRQLNSTQLKQPETPVSVMACAAGSCKKQRRPYKKRARVEADSDSSQLPVQPAHGMSMNGGGTFSEREFYEETSTTNPPPSVEVQSAQNLTGVNETGKETDSDSSQLPIFSGHTVTWKRSVMLSEEDLHEESTAATPPPSVEGQPSQKLSRNAESNECASDSVVNEKAQRLLAPTAAARPAGLSPQSKEMSLPPGKGHLVVSEKARRLLAPKAAAKPMGLWHRIAKRKEQMRSFEPKNIPFPFGNNHVMIGAENSTQTEDQAAIASPEKPLAPNVTVVSEPCALVLTPTKSTESIEMSSSSDVVDEVISSQADDQVTNNRAKQGAEQATLVRSTQPSMPKATTRRSKKVGNENHFRPNENNRQHYESCFSEKSVSPRKPTRSLSRTPLASIDMNAPLRNELQNKHASSFLCMQQRPYRI